MTYKTIVVHAGADARRRERLELAAGLAAGFDAHLVGLFALTELGIPFGLEGNAGAVIQAETRWRAEAAEAARADFHAAATRAGVAKNEWRHSERGASPVQCVAWRGARSGPLARENVRNCVFATRTREARACWRVPL